MFHTAIGQSARNSSQNSKRPMAMAFVLRRTVRRFPIQHAHVPQSSVFHFNNNANFRGFANEPIYEELLVKDGSEAAAIKKNYLKMAREFHPDANPDDPKASDKFVELGKMFETLMKKLKTGERIGDANDEESDYSDDEDEYGLDEAVSTFSAAGGPVITRQMRRELKRVTDEMSSGGARDGGWFSFAKVYGGDDGVKDLPGGPNLHNNLSQLFQVEENREDKRNDARMIQYWKHKMVSGGETSNKESIRDKDPLLQKNCLRCEGERLARVPSVSSRAISVCSSSQR